MSELANLMKPVVVKDPWALVHIPRTGGTTIRHMMRKYLSEQTHGMGAVFPEKRGHMPAWKLAERSDWDDIWSFAVVRNPFDRAVSLWGYCARQYGWKQWGDNFREWVRAGMPHKWGALPLPLFPGSPFGLPVTAPQVAWIYPWKVGKWWDPRGDLLVKFYWQFEQGVDWIWGEIWDRFGPAEPLPLTKHANKSEHRDWRTYYDSPTLDRVAMLYAEDLEAFEYELPAL